MAFAPQFLDEIRARLSLSDVVSRRVKLIQRGREHTGLCPFHNEKSPSFTVSNDKNFYHCFGCGAHGDVIGYLMQAEGVSFPEAVERLAAEAGLEVPVSSPEERAQEQRRAGLLEVMEAACAYYEKVLRSPMGKTALAYLHGRGLSDETISRFRLGFAPPGNSLKTAIMSDAMPEALLAEGGLVRKPDDGRPSYDFFRDRVLFPIGDARGRIIAFGGRTMGDGEPKYLNSPDTPLFDKRRTLYGLAQARSAAHDKHRILVTEGYMDVIALSQNGIAEAVAPLGTALSESHLALLWKVTNEPYLCFDGDNAGQRAAGRSAERALPLLAPERSLRFLTLPAGEDPDSLVSTQGAQAMEELITKSTPLDAVIWGLETAGREFDTPERIAGLEKRLEDRALSIADRKVQFQYQSLFRQKLRDMINAARNPGGNYGGRQGQYQGRGGGGNFNRGGGGNFNRGGGRGGRGAASWEDRRAGTHLGGVPDQSARSGPDILKKRHEQVLLAVILNHPDLLDMFAEDLAMVNVSNPKLDNLRQEILKVYALTENLDSEGLKTQLVNQGNSVILQSVLTSDVYVHAGFAKMDAAEDEVRTGFLQVLASHLAPGRRAELEDARRLYVNEPTDENWERFEKLKTDGPGSPGTEVPV
ncbi:MAG: DNA primase [Paracoccaceae bacterium]|jgi:DNA primase